MTLDDLQKLEAKAKAAEYRAKQLNSEAHRLGVDLTDFIRRSLGYYDGKAPTRVAAERVISKYGPELMTMIEMDLRGQAREEEAAARLAWAQLAAFFGEQKAKPSEEK